MDDLGALGDENTLAGVVPVEQLVLRQPGLNVQGGIQKLGDLNDI